jgi:transposase-like protein
MGLQAKHYHDADAAREHIEKVMWPNGPVCPHCRVIENIYRLESKETSKHQLRKGVYKCGGCRKKFTVTVGTIFEDSHISLDKWLLAIHLMCSSKKGVSALQLQRELWGEDEETKRPKGSYRTAWFMAHRIRWAMTQGPVSQLLKGIAEADETYIGGREKGVGSGRPTPERSKKTPVLALVERGGNVRSFPLERATLANIKPILQEHIDPSSHLVTDEFPVYYMMKEHFASDHEIQHKGRQYVRKDGDLTVTTNTVESFFALLKRSNYGIHHHMSRKYLAQYCAERDFVYYGRKLTDDERARAVLRAAEGRRLMLKEPKTGVYAGLRESLYWGMRQAGFEPA